LQGPPRSQSVTFHPRSHNRTSILRASRYAESSTVMSQSFNRGSQTFLSQN
jgi:hypothetical protein